MRMRKERFDGKRNPSWQASLLPLYLLRVDYDRGRMWDISEDTEGVWRGESAQDCLAQCRQTREWTNRESTTKESKVLICSEDTSLAKG